MNKIRKPGDHPGKGRVPGVRPISTKETRNRKKMERLMSDTASFVSETLRKVEEEYSSSMNLFTILAELRQTSFDQAEYSIAQVNKSTDDLEKIKILHQCIISIVNTIELKEQAIRMLKLKHQHETLLLNSMSTELSNMAILAEEIKQQQEEEKIIERDELVVSEEISKETDKEEADQ